MSCLQVSAAVSVAKRPPVDRLERRVGCPYCGEPLTILVDESDGGTDYIEDCQVCCQPMVVSVSVDTDSDLNVVVRREDE